MLELSHIKSETTIQRLKLGFLHDCCMAKIEQIRNTCSYLYIYLRILNKNGVVNGVVNQMVSWYAQPKTFLASTIFFMFFIETSLLT